MTHLSFTLALGTMLAACIFTPLGMIVGSDRAVKIGVITYVLSSLAVQELNPSTRSLNRSPEDIDCQS